MARRSRSRSRSHSPKLKKGKGKSKVKKPCKRCPERRAPGSKYCHACGGDGPKSKLKAKSATSPADEFDKVVASFKKKSVLPQVSAADAEAEVKANFRPNGPKKAKSMSKPQQKDTSKKDVDEPNIGVVIMYPYGTEFVNGHEVPRITKAPAMSDQQQLLDARLGVEGSFFLSITASHEEVDSFLRELLPRPFEYLDAKYGTDHYHYSLCAKDYQKIYICGRGKQITGELIDRRKGSSGRSHKGSYIRIISKHPIPSKDYEDWNGAIRRAISGTHSNASTSSESGSESSDNDEDGAQRSPKERLAKTKGKETARALAEENSVDEDGNHTSSSSDEEESSYFPYPLTQQRAASISLSDAAGSDAEFDRDTMAAIVASRTYAAAVSLEAGPSGSTSSSSLAAATVSTVPSRVVSGGKRKRNTNTSNVIDLSAAASSDEDSDNGTKRRRVAPRPTRQSVAKEPLSSPAQGFGRPSPPTKSVWD